MRGAHGRHHVDVEALGPACLVVGGAKPGRVVDQNIDAAERAGCRRDVGGEGVFVGEIAYGRVRLDTARQDLGRRRVERLTAARADRNRRARISEPERDRSPDTLAAAGDDGTLAFKLICIEFLLPRAVST